MEDNNLEFPFVFPKESKPVISIIGIGGGAGRIVNKIQACKLTDTELSVFGMNRKEMEELSLPHKYLIGADGLGSGKNRSLAESECQKILPSLEKIITDKILSCFIVCLGGGTGEGCIRGFLTETSPQLFGVCEVSTDNVVQAKDSIAFTDLDIAWFNPKTREIKFKEYDKIKSIPIYASISVKSSSETLFIIAANINPVVNRAYDDLVLFCDKDGKYYLNDNYPNYWNLEKTKQNADKRSEGWNKFINLLRKEGRIK